MATLKPGTSSPEVLKLQKTINAIFNATAVAETGTYDEDTVAKVAELQKKLKIGKTSGEADPATLKAFAQALVPKYLVEVGKVEAYLDAKELATLRDYVETVSLKTLEPTLRMARQFKSIWEAHNKVRDDHWFAKITEFVTDADFPDAAEAKKVESAAKEIESEASAGTLTVAKFDKKSLEIRDAYAKLDMYRDHVYDGGEHFAVIMEMYANGAADILDILMSVYTAKMSPGGQALGSGVTGTYKAALGEVIKASKTPNYSVSGGVGRALASGAVNAGIKYVLKGKGGEDFLKKVEEAAVKAGGTTILKKWIARALVGAGQQMMEDGLKGVPDLFDPNKKVTIDKLVDAAANSFIKGALLKPLGESAKNYGESAGKMFKPEWIKLPKGTVLTKEAQQLIKKSIEKAGGRAVDAVLETTKPGTSQAKFEAEVREKILADPDVKKTIKEATGK